MSRNEVSCIAQNIFHFIKIILASFGSYGFNAANAGGDERIGDLVGVAVKVAVGCVAPLKTKCDVAGACAPMMAGNVP